MAFSREAQERKEQERNRATLDRVVTALKQLPPDWFQHLRRDPSFASDSSVSEFHPAAKALATELSGLNSFTADLWIAAARDAATRYGPETGQLISLIAIVADRAFQSGFESGSDEGHAEGMEDGIDKTISDLQQSVRRRAN